MKKYCLILIGCILTMASYAQGNKGVPSFDLMYGQRSFHQKFYSLKNYQPEGTLQLVGVGISAYYTKKKGPSPNGHILYCQVIPRKLHLNDSISANIGGFTFSYMEGIGFLSDSASHFNIIFNIGVSTGRSTLRSSKVHQKNPFFAPTVAIQPRVKFGKTSITVKVDYMYDVSNTKWKNMTWSKQHYSDIEPFKQTALTGMIIVGFDFD